MKWGNDRNDRCEACGRKLGSWEGKICASCQAAISRSLKDADIVFRDQAIRVVGVPDAKDRYRGELAVANATALGAGDTDHASYLRDLQHWARRMEVRNG